MLSFSIVGCGAAGNKAVIDLMAAGYDPNKCYLVNSTLKDIPEEYADDCIIFGSTAFNRLGGCGKERSIGKEMLMADLKSNKIDVSKMIDPDDQAIILVGSTEGGSGSSSVPLLARYLKQVYNRNVICILFFGFNDDVRGMQNSIELCKELSDTYTVIGISNEKFLDDTNNKFLAEKKANELFCDIVKILSGFYIMPGVQMIDDTDLYKVATTPGYMVANTFSFNRPKTSEEYDKIINNFLNTQKFVDPGKNPGAKRIACIFDIPGDDDTIDYSGKAFRNLYGEPYEFFTHLRNTSDEYRLSFIVSGMKLPSEEIQNIYDNYLARTSKVNKDKDDFFDILSDMNGLEADKGFNMLSNTREQNIADAKLAFFGETTNAKTKESPKNTDY